MVESRKKQWHHYTLPPPTRQTSLQYKSYMEGGDNATVVSI